MFSQSSYAIDVLENTTVGYIVGSVSATDRDEGTNAEVRYMLSLSVNAPFRVDRVSGNLILRSSLDREDIPNYTLHVCK